MPRKVDLPPAIRGRLFLSSMPGRYEPLEQSLRAMQDQKVSRIVCLASLDEVRDKSPDYYRALEGGEITWPVEVCPVPDYGIPEDGGKFLGSVRRTADFIRSGRIVLVHCGAGKGRTGMFAVCTLIRLGMPPEVAHRIVSQADSGPETEEQCDFIRSVTPRLQAI